jgi:hypothetical protein
MMNQNNNKEQKYKKCPIVGTRDWIKKQYEDGNLIICNMCMVLPMKMTTNSYKFESTITALNNGKKVNKPKRYRFQIGDYLMYNKEKDFYFTLLCTNNKFVLE